MGYGFKSGGRKKGVKNKRTRRIESAARRLLDDAKGVLGDQGAKLFEGDAHALMVLTYKNPKLPLDVRMDAAKAAIRFEKPAFTQTAIDMSVRPVRAKDLSDDELAAIIVGGSKQLPAPSAEDRHTENPMNADTDNPA
jgi:hypothetical protein